MLKLKYIKIKNKMKGFSSKPLAFVDIETTGGSPQGGGIIEIAIITVKEGRVQETWSSLINPERSLSPMITSITGIQDKDLEYAPTFARLASEIYERLKGKIFVAHNARFDYSFVKNQLKMNDIVFNAPTLCTVKLSRSLFPRFKHHNLDILIERYNLTCKNRHRAQDDAQAMIDFIEAAEEKLGLKKVEKVMQDLLNSPALPPMLDKSIVSLLPEKTGVYIFKSKTGTPIYIGKSVNIKRRVLSHFSADHQSLKELKIKESIQDIEFKITEGELGALLLESQLIKQHLPLYNRKLRKLSRQIILTTKEDSEGYLSLEFNKGDELTAEKLEKAYGIFASVRSAQGLIEKIARDEKLCLGRLGLEKVGKGKTCFDYQLKQCEGACLGHQSALKYNFKLTQALHHLKHQTWPFNGPIGIQEGSTEKGTIHVLYEWCHLGSACSSEELEDILQSRQKPDFEFDTYKIVRSYLKKNPNGKIKLFPFRNPME